MENFELLGDVGKGSQGYVLKALDMRTGESVVLKFIERPEDEDDREYLREQLQEEASIYRTLGRHRNIVKFKGLLEDEIGKSFVLVFECLDNTLNSNFLFWGPDELRKIMKQVLKALAHCHKMGIIHLDVKPSNIMLSDIGSVKLIDFGISSRVSPDGVYSFTSVGTTAYMAPELLSRSTTYGTAVDIWSAGCVFAELLLRRSLFNACKCRNKGLEDEACTCMDETLKCITDLCGDFSRDSSSSKLRELLADVQDKTAVDLIERMLVVDPDTRITAAEALKSPYFTS